MSLVRSALNEPRSRLLVEREEPLATLRRFLDEASAGTGRVVLIRGEAGIGKTSLVKALLEESPPDVDVVWGACDGVSTPQPYGPFEDMADALGVEFRRLLDGHATRAEIGRWLLKWLAAGPVRVLVIEDIHWADQATLDLLAFLARRIESVRVLLLVTHRDGEGSAPSVDRILGGVASLPTLRQLPLEPLSRAGVERLTSDTGVDARELHRITAGNPFYVREVLDAGLSHIPISIRDAVRARVVQLDERGRRALQVAAIIGVRAEPWLLAAVAGEDILGIDDCLRIGLLTKADGIAFGHELTRMVVLEDVPVIRGIALHRRALDTLERGGGAATARLAYHAEGSADRDAVLRHAPVAGREALASGALHEAIAQFRRALRFADGLDPALRAELLEPLARALYLTNDLPNARAAGLAAVAMRRQAIDARATAADLAALALVAWASGRGEEAWTAAREAVALAEPLGDSHELGIAYATLGQLGTIEGDGNDGRALSMRAIELGRRLGDAEVVATALVSIGTLDLSLGEEAGWTSLEEAIQIGRQANLPAVVNRALNNLACAASEWRRFPLARDYFRQLADHASQSEIDRFSVDAELAAIALALGDFDQAEVFARATLASDRILEVDRHGALIVVAQLAVRRGEDPHEWLDQADRIVAGLPTMMLRLSIAAARAEQSWLAGDMATVVPELRQAYIAAREAGQRRSIGELGLWLWRAGALAELDERAEEPYRLEVAGRAPEAAAAWRVFSMPYEAALSLAGSSDAADVQRAHEELTRLGATAVAHKVALRLRELGSPVPRGPRPTTRANPRGLTEREWEIAGLLALGLSNAEIADRLVVSPKTVGHHVSAVLGKLGVRRRAEVAAAMREAGAPI